MRSSSLPPGARRVAAHDARAHRRRARRARRRCSSPACRRGATGIPRSPSHAGTARPGWQRARHALRHRPRRRPEAAVADHDGRDAALHLEAHLGMHDDGEVVVGMDVDESGRQCEPARIDVARPRRAGRAADVDDALAGDRHVGGARRRTRAIEQRGVADDALAGFHHARRGRRPATSRPGRRSPPRRASARAPRGPSP